MVCASCENPDKMHFKINFSIGVDSHFSTIVADVASNGGDNNDNNGEQRRSAPLAQISADQRRIGGL